MGVVSNAIFGAYFTTNQDIFTEFVVYLENGVPQRVEWSKYTSFKIFKMAVIFNPSTGAKKVIHLRAWGNF